MKQDFASFPIKPAEDITLCQDDIKKVKEEFPYPLIEKHVLYADNKCGTTSDKLMERYQYSHHIIDPNRRNFSMTVRKREKR